MDNLFSVGELANLQGISKQTLLYYDKIGLFEPCYVDPQNGYRYYSVQQLDYLDTILIMKKIGFSLEHIKQQMRHYDMESSMASFEEQLVVLQSKIDELSLIKSRLKHRCEQLEQVHAHRNDEVIVQYTGRQFLLCHTVDSPYTMKEVSIATKKCYAQALSENLPVFFQCGASVPLERLQRGEYEKASIAFLTTENTPSVKNICCLEEGLTAFIHHIGRYDTIGSSYQKLLEYCSQKRLKICSDSYEFCINDYMTSKYEDEFITKLMFYVEPKEHAVITKTPFKQ